MAKRSDQIKAALTRPREPERLTPDRFLSTGSTLLNLACSGRAEGGFLKGHYYHFVGDSQSGKTFLVLTCLAEAAASPHFSKYRLIYDDTEGGALMDFRRFFGAKAAARIEPPARDKEGNAVYSQRVEEFYWHVDDAVRAKRPFIYVLDSQDGLTSKAEVDKFQKDKRAIRRQKAEGDDAKVKGSYGDGKAKAHSSDLRQLIRPLQDTGSILLVVNQSRASFDMFEKSTYSGGTALLFYATLQLWSSVRETITRQVMGKKRQIGTLCKVRVKKNRVVGRDRSVLVPVYHSFGIDDVGSMVDYLVDEGQWERDGDTITVSGLGKEFDATREALIRRIESEGWEQDVRDLVAMAWDRIEAACVVERKARYE